MQEVHRGYIYRFDNGNGTTRLALAVGSEARATDKMSSILMLCDTGIGHDVVKLNLDDLGSYYVHCGMITYTRRDYLVEEIGPLPFNKMEKIDRIMASELALLDGVVEKARFYENAYNDLLAKVVYGQAEVKADKED